MRILCCGDRDWESLTTILSRLEGFDWKTTEIIHGDCRGADKLSAMVAENLGFKIRKFPADWNGLGKKAGPVRNLKMLDEKPDLVIAFHSKLHESRGTAHTVREANKRGIPVNIVSNDWWPVYVELPGRET